MHFYPDFVVLRVKNFKVKLTLGVTVGYAAACLFLENESLTPEQIRHRHHPHIFKTDFRPVGVCPHEGFCAQVRLFGRPRHRFGQQRVCQLHPQPKTLERRAHSHRTRRQRPHFQRRKTQIPKRQSPLWRQVYQENRGSVFGVGLKSLLLGFK